MTWLKLPSLGLRSKSGEKSGLAAKSTPKPSFESLSKILDVRATRRVKYVGSGISAAAAALMIFYGYWFHYPTFTFHAFVAVAVVVGIALPSLFMHFEGRRKGLIDRALPRLLEDLAESQEAGMTLLQSIIESSKRKYGPISGELGVLASQLTWGVPFEDAFGDFARRIGTELTTKVSVLLLEAVRLGGDLKTVFRSTANFVRRMIELREERETQLRPYMLIIYVSTLIFALVVVLMWQTIFKTMAGQGSSGFMRLPLSLEEYRAYLFDLGIIEALLGGFAVGKLSLGATLYGLKHSLVLLVLISLIFTIFF